MGGATSGAFEPAGEATASGRQGEAEGRAIAPLLVLSAVFTASAAYGQGAPEGAAPAGAGASDDAVPTIDVIAGRPRNVQQGSSTLSRTPTRVQDTPQLSNVIPKEVIEERGATNLTDVINRVPGVTMNAGEGGGGGQRGDNFNIRGFSAQGNIFVDGVRDIGVYNRDVFNLEAVEVLKGPSGAALGRGGGGGSINMQTKRPRPYSFIEFLGTIGTSAYYRGAIDANYALNDNIAIRINGLGLDREFAGRNHVEQTRWGFAPSITFGMNGPTSLTLQYLHQSEDGRPDTGVPRFGRSVADGGDGILRPVLSLGVPRNRFYGYSNDYEKMQADIGTATIEHRFNENFKLTNVTRIAQYDLDRWVTVMTPGTLFSAANCAVIGPNCFMTTHVRQSRGQLARTYQNQTTLDARFDTGPWRHEAVVGLDFSREHYDQYAYAITGTNPPGALNILTPAFVAANQTRARSRTDTHVVNTVGLSLYDRIALGYGFYFIGNARVENYSINSKSRNAAGAVTARESSSRTLWSWQTALQYKPTENQTYYISAGTAELPFSPSTGYVGVANAGGTLSQDPERATNIEAGAKFSLLDGRLGLGASIFHIERTNATDYDAVTGDYIKRNDKRTVRGVELQVDGRITDRLTVSAGYAYLDTEIRRPGHATHGQEIGLTPRHSGFVWANYNVTDRISLGIGATYVGERWTADFNPTATAVNGRLPSHWQVDAMASWKVSQNFELRLNATNLFDELTFERSHGARQMVPGAGRTILLTAKATF